MTYTLYIAENCHQCEELVNFMKKTTLSYKLVNVDLTDQKPPIEIYAFPALFKEDTLLCYGTDIKHFMTQKAQ